jgi:hypothetical protein
VPKVWGPHTLRTEDFFGHPCLKKGCASHYLVSDGSIQYIQLLTSPAKMLTFSVLKESSSSPEELGRYLTGVKIALTT